MLYDSENHDLDTYDVAYNFQGSIQSNDWSKLFQFISWYS